MKLSQIKWIVANVSVASPVIAEEHTWFVFPIIEGFGGSWKISFGIGLLLSVCFSWLAVQYTLFAESYGFPEYEWEIVSGMSFGLVSYIASAYRVVSLFMWKQTLMAAYTRGRYCICIYLSPYIKWVDGDIAFTYRSQSIVHSKK